MSQLAWTELWQPMVSSMSRQTRGAFTLKNGFIEEWATLLSSWLRVHELKKDVNSCDEVLIGWCAPQDKALWLCLWTDQIRGVDGDFSLNVTPKAKVDPSQYLVTDGHIYKRIDIPNTSSKQWRLEELDLEEAIRSMISDFGGGDWFKSSLYNLFHPWWSLLSVSKIRKDRKSTFWDSLTEFHLVSCWTIANPCWMIQAVILIKVLLSSQ